MHPTHNQHSNLYANLQRGSAVFEKEQTTDSADSDRTWAEFLHDHPECLGSVSYSRLSGKKEPQLMVQTSAVLVFIDWAEKKGYIGKPERIEPLRSYMKNLGNSDQT